MNVDLRHINFPLLLLRLTPVTDAMWLADAAMDRVPGWLLPLPAGGVPAAVVRGRQPLLALRGRCEPGPKAFFVWMKFGDLGRIGRIR